MLIGGLILLVVILVATTLFSGRPEIQQPIAFNHKKHKDNNVPCNYCHRFYETNRVAGIPPVSVCVSCHEDVIYVTPEKAKIQKYYREHIPIPWKQVYKAASHVFFSHRLHVTKGGIACESCHGNVADFEKPVTTQPVLLNMKNCIKCHETVDRIENPNECIRCHR